jgi:hypothetical protein
LPRRDAANIAAFRKSSSEIFLPRHLEPASRLISFGEFHFTRSEMPSEAQPGDLTREAMLAICVADQPELA